MRVLPIVISFACMAIAVPVMARPKPPKLKVAVAPLVGDSGNKIGNAVVDALAGKDFSVVGPREVNREMVKLGLPDELDRKAARKLAQKLGVVAVIDGKVGKAGGKRSLHLEVHRRGKPDAGFSVEFKSASSKGFRRGIHDEIAQKLEGSGDDTDDEDDRKSAPVADDGERKPRPDDDARPSARLSDNDDRPARTASEEPARQVRKSDDEAPRSRKPTGGKKSRRVAAADDDGENTAVRKRRTKQRDEDAALAMARVNGGVSVVRRQLIWETRSGFTQVPPRVGTLAGAGRIDGEIYPVALADASSSLAGLGLAFTYDRSFGLAIAVPRQNAGAPAVSAPISQSHYAIGARYRFVIGEASSVALGLDYAHRRYVAQRGGLMGQTLDTPDVDYSAIAPVAGVRVPVAASIAVFGGADGLLILGAGPITTGTSYGAATAYGLEATAGVDIAITKQIGVRIAAEYSQIMLSFNAKGQTMANSRDNDPTTQDITGATDRSIGVAATLGFTY